MIMKLYFGSDKILPLLSSAISCHNEIKPSRSRTMLRSSSTTHREKRPGQPDTCEWQEAGLPSANHNVPLYRRGNRKKILKKNLIKQNKILKYDPELWKLFYNNNNNNKLINIPLQKSKCDFIYIKKTNKL